MSDILKLIGKLKFIRDHECKTTAEVKAMNDAITELSKQPEQKWIPVSKKLPKEDTPVLVTDDAGGMATVGIDSCGRYEDTGERFWYTSQNVTAWMYTVKPYGGEQE